LKGEMALAKKYLVYFVVGMAMLMSLGTLEGAAAVPVSVQVQPTTQTAYGSTMVAIPVYLTNAGFDTIAGYRLTFNSSYPLMIDFNKNVDRTGSMSINFPTFETSVDYDSLKTSGDVLFVLGIANSSSYILPQTSGILFTLMVNVADSCSMISVSDSSYIYVAPFISQISDAHGNPIPSDSTSADTLILTNGKVYVSGNLNMGDINGSCKGQIPCSANLQDVIYLVNYIFDKSRSATGCTGTDPGNCWDPCPAQVADVNCSGGVNLSDVIYLVNYVFDKSRVSPPCNGSDPGTCWPLSPCP